MSESCFASCVLVNFILENVPAFVPCLLRDVHQLAMTVTSSGMERSGLAPNSNVIVSQMAQSRTKGL